MTLPAGPAPPRATTKNAIVELVLLALGDSKLKDLGLQAMRGVLLSDPRLAVLDGAVDLQAVWELCEGQPGWEPAAALAPFCFLKMLEPRLNVTVKLPRALAELSEVDLAKHAAACRPKREDVDRVVAGTPPPQVKKLDLPTAPPPPRIDDLAETMSPLKKSLLVTAGVVGLGSLVFVIYLIVGMLREPNLSGIEPAEFAGEIPVKSANKWGTEVHAVLGDPAWLKLPEDKRRQQLEQALNRLADKQFKVLILEDDTARPRASVQLSGKPPKVYVRFY